MKKMPCTSAIEHFSAAGRLFALSALSIASASLYGQAFWEGDPDVPDSFNVPGKWSTLAVPVSGTANIDNGGTVTVGAGDGTWSLNNLYLGSVANGSGNLLVNGGILTLTQEIHIGRFGEGDVTLDSGTINVTQWVNIGLNAGSRGVLNINGGTFNAITGGNSGHHFIVGRRGEGELNMTGGELNILAANTNLVVGDRSTVGSDDSYGVFNHSGGTANLERLFIGGNMQAAARTESGLYNISGDAVVNAKELIIGREGGSGRVEMAGGTITIETFFAIAHQNGAKGVLNQSGGTINKLSGVTYIGRRGSGAGVDGTWRMSGTARANLDELRIGEAQSTGRLIMNGGTLAVNKITRGDVTGTSIIELNGGRIVARSSAADFMQDLTMVSVQEGGVTFDTNGYDITIAQNLMDGGGNGTVIKEGLGTLTYLGENTYLGDTMVNEGILALAEEASMKFRIGTDGSSNMLGGSATAILSGMFVFEFQNLDSLIPNSWTLVNTATLDVSFTETFSVFGFSDMGDGSWSLVTDALIYTFSTATGMMHAIMVPEFSHTVLLLGALACGLVGVRRRMAKAHSH